LALGTARVGLKEGLTVLARAFGEWTSHWPASPQANDRKIGAWKEENDEEKSALKTSEENGCRIKSSCGEEDGTASLTISPWPFHRSFRIPLRYPVTPAGPAGLNPEVYLFGDMQSPGICRVVAEGAEGDTSIGSTHFAYLGAV
jgi:hypothetical protein